MTGIYKNNRNKNMTQMHNKNTNVIKAILATKLCKLYIYTSRNKTDYTCKYWKKD